VVGGADAADAAVTGLLAVLGALGAGVASALMPLVNAETYAVLAGARSGAWLAAALVLSLAVGQTAGKLVLFESARRGATRFAAKLTRSRWAGLTTGPPVVLVSAAIGLPPLAVVSLASGAAGHRRWLFAALCLLGRTARFAAIVLPIAWAR
jgi:membrane protein YqaA with SNARE-associated domain